MEPKKIARTATEALKIFWEEGFFNDWRDVSQIVEELSKRGNHFTSADIGMALKRAKHLTREGRRGNYRYIQKHPHFK